MECIDRYHEFKDEPFDKILIRIANGSIKCGRYSHRIKIKKNKVFKGKEFFEDDSKSK